MDETDSFEEPKETYHETTEELIKSTFQQEMVENASSETNQIALLQRTGLKDYRSPEI